MRRALEGLVILLGPVWVVLGWIVFVILLLGVLAAIGLGDGGGCSYAEGCGEAPVINSPSGF